MNKNPSILMIMAIVFAIAFIVSVALNVLKHPWFPWPYWPSSGCSSPSPLDS